MLEQLKERKKCVFHFLTRFPTHLEVRIGDSLLNLPRRLAAYRPPRQTSRWRSTRRPPHPHDASPVFPRPQSRLPSFMHCDRAYLSVLRTQVRGVVSAALTRRPSFPHPHHPHLAFTCFCTHPVLSSLTWAGPLFRDLEGLLHQCSAVRSLCSQSPVCCTWPLSWMQLKRPK